MAMIGSLAPQGTNVVVMIVIFLSRSFSIVREAITPGTPHPLPISIGMKDLPERPNLRKILSMMNATRAMSPDVVAVDELGCEEDFKAVDSVIHCGCKLIATAHGSCLEDVLDQPFFYKLMGEKVFERYIILDKNDQAGCLKAVLDENGKVCLEQ